MFFCNCAGHPRLGTSWEGYVLEQFLRLKQIDEAYFWSTYSGAELDLLFSEGGKRYGVEFKFNEAPRTAKAMHIAIADLNLEHLFMFIPAR